MRLVFHIGSPKTATSTLQHFFYLNRKALLAKGILYGYLDHRAINMERSINPLAESLATGKAGRIRSFFRCLVRQAKQANAGTILVSGENFFEAGWSYIRTQSPWHIHPCLCFQKEMLGRLRACLPEGLKTDIVCYLRRHDLHLESAYGEFLKGRHGCCGDIGAFFQARPLYMLHYSRRLDLWAGYFGREHIQVRNFELAKPSICEDFLVHVLGIEDTADFVGKAIRRNERLNRDILEYIKRLKGTISSPRRLMDVWALRQLSQEMAPDDRGYHHYLPLELRRRILADCREDNACLVSEFKMPGTLACGHLDAEDYRDSYPGLSPQRLKALEDRLAQFRSRPSYKLMYLCRRISAFQRARLPFMQGTIAYIRDKSRLLYWLNVLSDRGR